VVKQRHALFEDEFGLANVLLVVDHLVIEGLHVGRQTLGPEGADIAGDLGPELGRVGDRRRLC